MFVRNTEVGRWRGTGSGCTGLVAREGSVCRDRGGVGVERMVNI